MKKLTSILVVASRTATDRMLLEKAVSVARLVGAQIHLFTCDATLAPLLRVTDPTEEAEKAWDICVEEHVTYLRHLQSSVFAPGVQISVDAACHSPLYEGIVAKIREIGADLVMKAPAGEHPLRRLAFDSNEWKLTKSCRTTLMLVRCRPWRAIPKFAALVDMSEEDTAQFAQTIVHTSEYFSLGCHGELDVVYSERSVDEREKSHRLDSLHRLVKEYHVDFDHVHVLSGDPNLALPDFASKQTYDALVLGALTHRKGIAGVWKRLTSRIADTTDCDLILVQRSDRDLVATDEPRAAAPDCAALTDPETDLLPAMGEAALAASGASCE